jgi:hypothetical protein
MRYRTWRGSVLPAVLFTAAISLSVGILDAPSQASLSCFAAVEQMTCFDTVQTMPVVPVMPPIIVPGGAGTSGEDHHITIRDDGGYEAAYG